MGEYISQVERLLLDTRGILDGLEIYPRGDSPADAILLGLLSKSIVLAQAVAMLTVGSFAEEAFGLCRSSVEIQLTVRYLTNAETVLRTRRYFHYFAKARSVWFRAIAKYSMNLDKATELLDEDLETLAASYRDPNSWSKPTTLKHFAAEADNFITRNDGSPFNELAYYEIHYKLMSHFVHSTEPAIDPSHVTVPGDPFTVHPNPRSELGVQAIRIATASVMLNLIRIFRWMKMEIPEGLRDRFSEVIQGGVPPQTGKGKMTKSTSEGRS